MENAADALKIAFAIFVFAMAIMLSVSVVGQAKQTSEIVFKLNDKTTDYEYITADDYNAEEQRIVGFETILPTIYRYAKEQYAVTIFDKDGNPIVRYDLYTEGFMGNWNDILKKAERGNEEAKEANRTIEEVRTRLKYVENIVNKETGKKLELTDNLSNLYKGKSDYNTGINIVSPWMGDPNNDIIDRIICDMTKDGKYTKNGITYYGKNLNNYKNTKFKEFFVELYTSGETVTEGEYSIETIKGNKKLEIIYIEDN